MNIVDLLRLCPNSQLIEIRDRESKERIFYGLIINVPYYKKWVINYIYSVNDVLTVYVKKK